jgi:hypothetical protein
MQLRKFEVVVLEEKCNEAGCRHPTPDGFKLVEQPTKPEQWVSVSTNAG